MICYINMILYELCVFFCRICFHSSYYIII
nr:MAG TPA: hypothetical protein [Caudoviricetes sp.]